MNVRGRVSTLVSGQVVFLVLLILSIAQVSAQFSLNYKDYEGTYTLPWSSADSTNFIQFDLRVTDLVTGRAEMEGNVLFFADTLHTDIDPECESSFHWCQFSRDSLCFRSGQCFGVSYEFRGRFLGVPADFRYRPDDAVLEGILLRRHHNRIVKKADVRFLLEWKT